MRRSRKTGILAVMVLVMATFLVGTAVSAPVISDSLVKTADFNAPVEKVFKYFNLDQISVDQSTGKVSLQAWPTLTFSNGQGEGVGSVSDYEYISLGQAYRGKKVTVEAIPNQKTVDIYSGDINATITTIYMANGAGSRIVQIWQYTFVPKGKATAASTKADLSRQADESYKIIKQKIEGK